MDLAIAQRAKLYSDRPPVYPELHVSFESAEEYAKASIFRNILDSDEETELAADRVAGFRSDSQSPEPISDPLETVIDKLALAKLEHPSVTSKV
jgi:hypothetical protein